MQASAGRIRALGATQLLASGQRQRRLIIQCGVLLVSGVSIQNNQDLHGVTLYR